MPTDSLDPVLSALARLRARGESLRPRVDLVHFDAWREEVRTWLHHAVSVEEAQKFSGLIDGPVGRGIVEFYDWMIVTRLSFLDGLRIQLERRVLELPSPASLITFFVSHSAADEHLAGAVVEFLRACIDFPDHVIRCTSVPGYKLETGTSTSATLRAEVRAAKCAIGLITTSSVQASWVLFELGARWGRELHVAPILHPDAQFDMLPGPLKETHAVKLNDEPGMLQLVEELSLKLGYPKRSPTLYPRARARLAEAFAATASTKVERSSTASRPKARAQKSPKSAPLSDRPTSRDIRKLLVESRVGPSEAAKALSRLGSTSEVIAEVLREQEDYLRDLDEPSTLDKMLAEDALTATNPHEHLERVVSRLCEHQEQIARPLLVAAGRRAIQRRIKKGGHADWHYRVLMKVLAAELREVFGREAGAVAEEMLDGLGAGDETTSALDDLVVRPKATRRAQKPTAVDKPAPIMANADVVNRLTSWMQSRPDRDNRKLIVFDAVDPEAEVPAGSAKKHLAKIGTKIGYSLVEEGETTILFERRREPSRESRRDQLKHF
ncbi:MAG: TIR domain-containing protein [Pseudomonadota bacterium]|nr:TIR domain-containing protein [Pseudomonadota bacterium]